MTIDKIKSLIRTIPDVPSPGIMFHDITPLCADTKPHKVIGVEARGCGFCAGAQTRQVAMDSGE